MSDKKLCFVIAPIGEPDSDTRKRSDRVLEDIIRPAVAACGYTAERADKIGTPGMITSQIIQRIVESRLVVADLTEQNPNVFYELAIRHAICKPFVQLIKKGERIPFNVAGMRTIQVDHENPDGVEAAKCDIIQQIKSLEQNSSNLETPISPVLPHGLTRATSNNILFDCYPPSYPDDLARAKELWITGLNLRRIFPDHVERLRQVIQNGGTINVILLSRESDAIKYSAQQDYGSGLDVGSYLGLINSADACLRELKKSAPNQVNIKTIDYPLPFGVDAVDIESPNGIIYVRHYPLNSGDGDKPILVLRRQQSQWYEFYKNQLNMQWKHYAALYHAGWNLRIDRATDELVPAITALADKVALSNLPEAERQKGFLLPYTAAQYADFARRAEHFYILCLGKQLIGFVLAHPSEQIDLFGEEVYLYIKNRQTPPFIVVRQICIDPNFSRPRRGYGRTLYDFLFKHSGIDTARYRTAVGFIWKRPPNPGSEKFHRAVGWKESETYSLKNGDGVVAIWTRTI